MRFKKRLWLSNIGGDKGGVGLVIFLYLVYSGELLVAFTISFILMLSGKSLLVQVSSTEIVSSEVTALGPVVIKERK